MIFLFDTVDRLPCLFRMEGSGCIGFTNRLLSSSFWELPYKILNMNHRKDLLRSLWVGFGDAGHQVWILQVPELGLYARQLQALSPTSHNLKPKTRQRNPKP